MFNGLEMYAGEVHMTEESVDRWVQHYGQFLQLQKDSPPFLQTMAERLTDKALKAAIINAAWAESKYIEIEHLEMGIDWANYLHDCLRRMLPEFGSREQTLLASIERGRNTKRMLYNDHGHLAGFTSETIERSLKGLVAIGMLQTAGYKFKIKVDKPK